MENDSPKNSMVCKIKSNLLFLFNATLAALIVFLIKHDGDIKKQEQQKEDSVNQELQKEKLINNQQIVSTDRENLLRDLNTTAKEQKKIETTTTTTTTTPEPVTIKKEVPKADSKTKSS